VDGEGSRGRLALGIALIALLSLVALVLALNGGGANDDDAIRAERFLGPGPTELLVYVDPDANEPETADGARRVELECVDRRGRVVVKGAHEWPFTDTDGGIYDPHSHQPALPAELRAATSCRLRGTDLGEADVTDFSPR
jgi:hypothetical protein